MALADNALTTVATMEAELGIASGTEDAKLQRAINEASAIAEAYARRVFYRNTAISEKTLGGDGPYMFLTQGPINSITSISFLGSAISSGDYEIHDASAGIVFAISGSWSRVGVHFADISRTQIGGMDRKPYTVVYDGGWYTPKQDDDDVAITRNLPYDLERAVLMIATYLYRSVGRDVSVKQERLGDSSITYNTATVSSGGGTGGWLSGAVPGAAAILNRYRAAILS